MKLFKYGLVFKVRLLDVSTKLFKKHIKNKTPIFGYAASVLSVKLKRV